MSDNDRTVYAFAPNVGAELVRYDRAGKWYIEYPGRTDMRRGQLSVRNAAAIAAAWAYARTGHVRLDLPGGRAFDAAFRRASRLATPTDGPS